LLITQNRRVSIPSVHLERYSPFLNRGGLFYSNANTAVLIIAELCGIWLRNKLNVFSFLSNHLMSDLEQIRTFPLQSYNTMYTLEASSKTEWNLTILMWFNERWILISDNSWITQSLPFVWFGSSSILPYSPSSPHTISNLPAPLLDNTWQNHLHRWMSTLTQKTADFVQPNRKLAGAEVDSLFDYLPLTCHLRFLLILFLSSF
jgi:hypothetical protein